ncbi:SPOR domain-containing protein [Thermodesulfobacteriota bacterium]
MIYNAKTVLKRKRGSLGRRLAGKSLYFAILLLLNFACQSTPSGKTTPVQWEKKDQAPQRVVVLPFENHTPETDLEIICRKSFYSHFSSKNYQDVELTRVDRGLKLLSQSHPGTWKDLDPTVLGNFFRADFLIYGRVKDFKKIFLGIYSLISLTLELEIKKINSEEVFWSKTITERSHDGGIPFDLFGIIPAALRSGLHMQQEKSMDLIDRLNRELAAQIPNPPAPAVALSLLEIQVASFVDKKRAMMTLKEFEGRGYKPRVVEVSLGETLWHRIILGPYYDLPAAKKARSLIARDTSFQPIIIKHDPLSSNEKP